MINANYFRFVKIVEIENMEEKKLIDLIAIVEDPGVI